MAAPSPSRRIIRTDDPCIVTMQKMMRGTDGILSLAQGIVHWKPPATATNAAAQALQEGDTNSYCADDGLVAFRDALKQKLREENGMTKSDVMVTSGSNQAYMNLAISLLDEGDGAVLFAPYYFNHAMALQMTSAEIVIGKVDQALLPDLEWLEQRLKATSGPKIKMVTLVNPGNPSGVMLPPALLAKAQQLCDQAGAWLVCDNAYEYFSYEPDGAPPHTCLEAPNVVNLFSFSKSFGMMGWRIGYIAYPEGPLGGELFKVQDTVPICPPVISQKAALGAMESGRAWVKEQVAGLSESKKLIRGVLEETLGKENILGGSGAIYLMAKLPATSHDDVAVVEYLAKQHKVCVIPGAACGFPGYIRVCYSNLKPDVCEEAARRLRQGLTSLPATA
eukprot:CAMPEP_0177699786 /NCGR_PEP_ID=MMETSP0484_2-20121128/5761_1 /TAXON_ID=354590 /ORGANISM="Rhodomonas lens, Strain RHODO" /LENGTH=391 /DNA_ID=CAMNT_0019210971 /DNA_START=136 /DNA_END=1311 /DNA_ORIENTATION=+